MSVAGCRMSKDSEMIQFLETDFGIMKMPIPVSEEWIKNNRKDFNLMVEYLTNYMEVAWLNSFKFTEYKDGAIWKNT